MSKLSKSNSADDLILEDYQDPGTKSAYLQNKYQKGRRSWMKRKYTKNALRKTALEKTLSRISGYPEYQVKDFLHALACLLELKLAMNETVILEGIGLFYRKAHQKFERDCYIQKKKDVIYRTASVGFVPDKWMRDALNTTPDNFKIDWSSVEPEAIFAGIKKYYEQKYGKDFEILESEKYGIDSDNLEDDLEQGLKYLQEVESSQGD